MKNFVPFGQPPSLHDVSRLTNFLKNNRTVIISGAGISTESGIPDYRSPKGSYSTGHKPVMHQEFEDNEYVRKRYWARSVLAASYFREAKPNTGHLAITQLERMGFVEHVITQNVDRLHQRAGTQNVFELHGNIENVECLYCGTKSSRKLYHQILAKLNSAWYERLDNVTRSQDIRADGDINLHVDDFSEFQVPNCSFCGKGIIKPTIVFFGGHLTTENRQKSIDIVDSADQLLVIGSSISVGSAFRLCRIASNNSIPIAVVNIGPTRADQLALFKIDNCVIGDLLDDVVDLLAT